MGQRVIEVHDQHQRVIAKRPGLQLAGVDRTGDHADIGCIQTQRMGNAQAGELLLIDTDSGVLAHKVGEQLGQVFGEGGSVAQQAHTAFEALGVFAQVVIHALDLLQEQARMLCQRLPGRCRTDTTPAALQKGHAQGRFHRPDPRTGGGQR